MTQEGPESSAQGILVELVGMAYEAAADPTKWEKFLAAYTESVQGARGSLVLSNLDQRHSFTCFHGWSGEELAYYTKHYAEDDAWRDGTITLPEGHVGPDTDLCPREEAEACLAYREFYAPRGMIYGMGAIILVNEGGRSIIVAMRGPELGPFGGPQIDLARSLLPHLRRAAVLHGELSSLRSQLAVFTSHLNRYPQPFLLVNSDSEVLFANETARAALGQSEGLWLKGDGTLRSARLRKTFREMIAKPSELLRSLQVASGADGKAKTLLVSRLQDNGTVPLGTSQPALAVVIVDSDQNLELDSSLLQKLFAITPAEARILGHLVQGRSFDVIARETGVSVGTVRTHVKRIFSKTGTTRQGELISLILRALPFQR